MIRCSYCRNEQSGGNINDNHLNESPCRDTYSSCNFMEKSCVWLRQAVSMVLVVLNDTGMVMYDVAVKARLSSTTHFHTWLTCSPSFWVASLLKALRPLFHGEFSLTDYTRAAVVAPWLNTHSVNDCLYASVVQSETWGNRWTANWKVILGQKSASDHVILLPFMFSVTEWVRHFSLAFILFASLSWREKKAKKRQFLNIDLL